MPRKPETKPAPPKGAPSKPVNKSPHQVRIEEFMRQAEQVIPVPPTMPPEEVRQLRARLILEEALETIEALGFDVIPFQVPHQGGLEYRVVTNGKPCDVVKTVDGCCDLSVVTIGTLSAFGLPDNPFLCAVDQSNLAKFKGDGYKDEHGKWIKPSDWEPPQLKTLLAEHKFPMEDND